MLFRSICILLICLSGSAHLTAQTRTPIIQSQTYPQNYFRSPLDIPHQASGTFGELRSTHFHAGDDYRTQQRVGLPLFAVAEGYISRLRIQAGGGGHSLYINHPNGYTSVYLHMDRFAPAYEARVREEQYRQKSFVVDINLEP
ncbi:MAG TPA: M23 family metallopeptidase, partial [Sphingobacteriaceae bacterium]|nr:M23 family metallopeptidase [Sphingobacteriaceae bacterium]